MTIYFELVKRYLEEKLQEYIRNSEAKPSWSDIPQLSDAKRQLARGLLSAIQNVESTDDETTQKNLDTLLRTCVEKAIHANTSMGGSQGRLEALIDEARPWLERLLTKSAGNHLINIPHNNHPFSIFCQKMMKYFDHRIHVDLAEWRATNKFRQYLGFTIMPLEKETCIHKSVIACIAQLAGLAQNKKDYPQRVKTEVINALKSLKTDNSDVADGHGIPVSVPLFWGFVKLPIGQLQLGDGFLGRCITEATEEISALGRDDLQRIVEQTIDMFQKVYELSDQTASAAPASERVRLTSHSDEEDDDEEVAEMRSATPSHT